MPELVTYLQPLQEWLAAQALPGDFVLIQGDFGAPCLKVWFARQQGFISVNTATRRISRDEPRPDDSSRTTHPFRHQRFRKYGV